MVKVYTLNCFMRHFVTFPHVHLPHALDPSPKVQYFSCIFHIVAAVCTSPGLSYEISFDDRRRRQRMVVALLGICSLPAARANTLYGVEDILSRTIIIVATDASFSLFWWWFTANQRTNQPTNQLAYQPKRRRPTSPIPAASQYPG